MRIRPTARGRRAGITLTEILISIMIMGVGMLSLATLFPLGLDQLRKAARSSRSAMLIETATSEISSRDLLYKPSFQVTNYGFDPFTQDPPPVGDPNILGLNRSGAIGTGVPICYDPLWWYQVYIDSGGAIQPTLTSGAEFRFGSGIDIIRGEGKYPSAHGLQRITNFPLIAALGGPLDPASLFASPDDPVMQSDGTASVSQGRGSPVVPDLSTNARQYNYSYTWIFTGKQTDVTNGTIFDGDIVIFNNRPFATAKVAGKNTAAGETVVEAIWGYDSSLTPGPGGTFLPYGRNNRSVLLRWSASQPDPDVRTGGWIADVTYERSSDIENQRFYPPVPPLVPPPFPILTIDGRYPAQRCYWYRIAKKAEPTTTDLAGGGYRQMVVTLSSDLRAKTELKPGQPQITSAHINAALICPSVVNVVSRVFYTR